MKHPTDRFASLRAVLAPIHPEGWRFAAIAAVAALILFAIWQPLGWIGVALAIGVALFFRDPWRVSPQRADLALAPADGEIVAIDTAPPPPELEMGEAPMLRIAIFLSLLNVHINRAPMAGKIVKIVHRDGRFHDARDPRAGGENERNAIRLARDGGAVAIVQIAGRIARRIRCDAIEGQELIAGQRFGLIRFGSRAEIFLPADWMPLVHEGQRAIGGETALAAAPGAGIAASAAFVTH
jgi:phosphatidylserine decarboxylase